MPGVSGTTERQSTATESHNGRPLSDDFREVSTFAQNSLEITKGQSGKIGWSVKVYCIPGQELAMVDTIWELTMKIKVYFGEEAL